MTRGLTSLGAATDLWDASWSGWTYPQFRTEQPLIGNGVDAGNLAIQEGSKAYREATLTFVAPDLTQKDLVRGFWEAGDQVDFTDFDGSVCTVLVADFSSSLRFGDVWNLTVRLLQLTEPAIPGS